ncbi:Nuclear aminoacylation-dependent tRNA export pathway component [Malassezia vespertilionis]|uniref:Protein kinase domain-containing protein n=1 Tax=Malassezia vespertilionis TaxID=2020962 RepID=A0A2N1J7D5_9BASI|nr:Nuclear aminoacylation-dependent tRNA export pathway component [Malassezia vespertilionis]PKI82372.1 hypothetical protein MVES_003573 [Malassezia vespertilionis]WFD07960.1 Nuclear aminoacylation-dependent tRNA export pathway component [Malassezia vespertilionis]
MDYFRQLSSALAKGINPLPGYSIGDPVLSYDGKSIWKLHDGVRKEDQVSVSIFLLDTSHASPAQIAMAQHAVRKLRSVRFPHVLKFLETSEAQGVIYLAVERVTPLATILDAWRNGKPKNLSSTAWIAWGINQLASAAAFLNEQVHSVHGNIHRNSVFISPGGEWLLGGFETLSTVDEMDWLAQYGSETPSAQENLPPELQYGWRRIAPDPIHAIDSYAIGALAVEAFNNKFPADLTNFSAGRIPSSLHPLLKRMLLPTPAARLSSAELVAAGAHPNGFLQSNELTRAGTLMEEFRVADAFRKEGILIELEELQTRIAPSFVQYRVLPILVEAFCSTPSGHGGMGALDLSTRVLLPLMLGLAKELSTQEWTQALGPTIFGAYTTPYPSLRAALLVGLPIYKNHLDAKTVGARIWPAMTTWFDDRNEAVRGAVLTSIPILLPHLSERVLNNDLLRLLAKTQQDSTPLLRIQTTELLGKITPHLTAATRANVLVPAFSRSLKDTYEQARLAGVEAFAQNEESFDGEASAKSVLPALAPYLVDKNKEVREKAHNTLQQYMGKALSHAATLSTVESELPAPTEMAGHTRTRYTRTDTASRSAFSSFWSVAAGNAASALGDWALAQIDADEAALQTAKAPEVLTPQGQQPEPAPLPLLEQRPADHGMSLGKKSVQDTIVPDAFQTQRDRPVLQVPKLATTKLTPAAHPKPPAATTMPTVRPMAPPQPASTLAAATRSAPTASPAVPTPKSTTPLPTPKPGLSKEEKMAQLQKLREERRTVRNTQFTNL